MTKPKLYTIVRFTAGFAAQAVLFSADKKAAPVPTAPAAQAGLLGEFSGEWRGKDDSSGTLKVKFSRGQDAAWTATTKSVKVDGVKVELVFAWQVQGTSAASTLKGELQGDKLEGTYESTTAEGAATGTWKTTRTPARS